MKTLHAYTDNNVTKFFLAPKLLVLWQNIVQKISL